MARSVPIYGCNDTLRGGFVGAGAEGGEGLGSKGPEAVLRGAAVSVVFCEAHDCNCALLGLMCVPSYGLEIGMVV